MTTPIEAALIKAVQDLAEHNHVSLVDLTLRPAKASFIAPHGFLMFGQLNPPKGKHYISRSFGDPEGSEWHLWHEVLIAPYKFDLIMETGYSAFAIECDGYDYHDRTKQQAAYDRARDRWFLARGYSTIRFTGSELTHSAIKCAQEVYEIGRVIDRRAGILAKAGFSDSGIPWEPRSEIDE